MSEENIPSENSKKEILNSKQEEVTKNISQQETIEQTQNTKLETENMEVHHHPHVEKKNFKEYFLEFLMIFLAVTMGFFAENIREHFTEEKNTREYLETFQQELKRNKTILNDEKKMLQEHEPIVDSLVAIFDEGKENSDLKKTYALLNFSVVVFTPRIETSAYQQMVNSGGLKNINNVALKDTLALYIDQIEHYKAYNQYINNQLSNTAPDVLKVMDIRAMLRDDSVKTIRPFII
ncbi:MAG TPA: hypothetical protein VGI61_03540, partial [Parafilimonas sp.]